MKINALLVTGVLLAGCAVGPNYQKPELDIPASWHEGWHVAQPQDSAPKGKWWEIFGNTELNQLEDSAFQHNQTLQASFSRVEQARALAQISRGAYFPTLQLNIDAIRNQPSANRPNNARNANLSTNIQQNINPVFTAAYEVDLFGRISRDVEATQASQEQSQADYENIKLILASDVAANYFNLCAQENEITALKEIIDIQKNTLALIHFRIESGASSRLDSLQQETLLQNAQAQLSLLENQRKQTMHALATLVGIPIEKLSISNSSLPAIVPDIPLDLPANVLQRRPDIAAAERAVAVANAQIGVAKAAWFPALRLTASRGWQSNELNRLFDAPSIVWSLGLGVTQAIFDGKRNSARVAFAQAGHEIATANYRQAVLIALQEVEDGLSADQALSNAIEQNRAAEVAASQAAEIIDHQYKNGLATSFELFVARKAQLENQRLVQQLRGQRFINSVYLIKTLGGGWHDTPLNTSKAAQLS